LVDDYYHFKFLFQNIFVNIEWNLSIIFTFLHLTPKQIPGFVLITWLFATKKKKLHGLLTSSYL